MQLTFKIFTSVLVVGLLARFVSDAFLIGHTQEEQKTNGLTQRQHNSLRRALYHSNRSIDDYCNTPSMLLIFSGVIITCQDRAFMERSDLCYNCSSKEEKLNCVQLLCGNVLPFLSSDSQFSNVVNDVNQILRYLHSTNIQQTIHQNMEIKSAENIYEAWQYLANIKRALFRVTSKN